MRPLRLRPWGESNSQPQRPQRRALSIELQGQLARFILLQFTDFNKLDPV